MATASDPDRVLAALRPERIEAHLRFLSSPLLEGRGVGTRGGRIAEEYIRSVFVRAGLVPPLESGYRQEVPMVGMTPAPELSFRLDGGRAITPVYRDEYVLEAGLIEQSVSVDSDLVFVGYGIHAPEYGWSDYEGRDVAGKVLLIRVNDPGTPETPDFFEGRALSYYGRWTYKFEEAARRGAAGALLIHTDASAGYGWQVVRNSNIGEQYQLAGAPRFPLPVRGWVTERVGRSLLSAAGEDPDRLLAASEEPGFRSPELRVAVRAAVRSELREASTANIVGLLPGTDPSRAGEPIVLMAHHDHLGVRTEGDRQVVYPGAHDNASGVALVLAIAEAFAEAGGRLPRPLIFLASTAEESGLLGAEWYARHPLVPLSRTAAVLNVDGANLEGPTEDIAPLGVDRSTLGMHVRAAAGAEGLEVSPEQHPEQGSFFRQDHFPFARSGVPGIAFDHGLRFRDKPAGWGELWFEEFLSTQYHQPADAFREDFDYGGAVQQGRVMIRTAFSVADAAEIPDWVAGSSFRRG